MGKKVNDESGRSPHLEFPLKCCPSLHFCSPPIPQFTLPQFFELSQSCLPVLFLLLGKSHELKLLCHCDPDANLPRSGTGYIGSFTTLALLEAGYKVVVADNLYNSSAEALNRIELICGKKAEFVQLDVTNEKDFDKVFEAHPDIDSVIHFAALKVWLF